MLSTRFSVLRRVPRRRPPGPRRGDVRPAPPAPPAGRQRHRRRRQPAGPGGAAGALRLRRPGARADRPQPRERRAARAGRPAQRHHRPRGLSRPPAPPPAAPPRPRRRWPKAPRSSSARCSAPRPPGRSRLAAAAGAQRAQLLATTPRSPGQNVYILGTTFENTADRLVAYGLAHGMRNFGVVYPAGLEGETARDAVVAAVNAPRRHPRPPRSPTTSRSRASRPPPVRSPRR